MIYFNGDSHVAGDGLADYQLPNYPGTIKSLTDPMQEKWCSIRRKYFLDDMDLCKSHMKENYKLSWAHVVAGDKPYINRARGGSSLWSIVANSILDLEKLDKVDFVFIGLPSYERLHLVTKPHIELDEWVGNVFPSGIDRVPNEYKDFFKESWLVRSVEDLLVHYLFEMTALNNYVKNKFGIYPIYINTGLNIPECVIELENGLTKIGTQWLGPSRLLEVDIHLIDFYMNEGYLGDGHYTKLTQDNLARYIKDRYNL